MAFWQTVSLPPAAMRGDRANPDAIAHAAQWHLHCILFRRTERRLPPRRVRGGACVGAQPHVVKMNQLRTLRRGILLLACALAAVARAEAVGSLPVVEVAPGAYVHQGVHEEISTTNHGDIANIGFVIGTECVAIIDTGGSPELGAALRATVREHTPLPVCYVINTHMHPDHVLGNVAFQEDEPLFIGHARLPRALAMRAEHYRENVGRALGRVLDPQVIVLPQHTVETTDTIDLGGRLLRLTAHSTAHTDNDLSVLDVQTGTLWLGDLLFVERIPALDGSLVGWLSVLEELRRVSAERVVPGHGPPAVAWPEAAAPLERYLGTLAQEIRAIIREDGTIEQAIEEVGLGERGRWELFDDYHQRNVTAAYAELEWEE
jgi:quinoprotein relay system zinc metallohydrolase 2